MAGGRRHRPNKPRGVSLGWPRKGSRTLFIGNLINLSPVCVCHPSMSCFPPRHSRPNLSFDPGPPSFKVLLGEEMPSERRPTSNLVGRTLNGLGKAALPQRTELCCRGGQGLTQCSKTQIHVQRIMTLIPQGGDDNPTRAWASKKQFRGKVRATGEELYPFLLQPERQIACRERVSGEKSTLLEEPAGSNFVLGMTTGHRLRCG